MCKGYIEKYNNIVYLEFVIDTIQIRVDLYKRINLLCLYVNDYILSLFFFIYYCLYCLQHNLFAYIVCLYWLNQGK